MCSGIVFYNRGTTTCRTSFSLSESRNRPLPAHGRKGPVFLWSSDVLLAIDRKELVRIPVNIAINADRVAAARDRQAAKVAALRVRVSVLHNRSLEHVAVRRIERIARRRIIGLNPELIRLPNMHRKIDRRVAC